MKGYWIQSISSIDIKFTIRMENVSKTNETNKTTECLWVKVERWTSFDPLNVFDVDVQWRIRRLVWQNAWKWTPKVKTNCFCWSLMGMVSGLFGWIYQSKKYLATIEIIGEQITLYSEWRETEIRVVNWWNAIPLKLDRLPHRLFNINIFMVLVFRKHNKSQCYLTSNFSTPDHFGRWLKNRNG